MLDDLGYFNRPEAGFPPLHPGLSRPPLSFLAGQWRLAVPSAVVEAGGQLLSGWTLVIPAPLFVPHPKRRL